MSVFEGPSVLFIHLLLPSVEWRHELKFTAEIHSGRRTVNTFVNVFNNRIKMCHVANRGTATKEVEQLCIVS